MGVSNTAEKRCIHNMIPGTCGICMGKDRDPVAEAGVARLCRRLEELESQNEEVVMENGTKTEDKGLIDLNNHLFAQMERLTGKDIKDDELKIEILRSKSVSMMAQQIISNTRLAFDAHVAVSRGLIKNPAKMLGVDGSDEKEI